jgi:lipopolysaccharide transport system permease protein
VTTSQIESLQSERNEVAQTLSASTVIRIEPSRGWFTFDLKELWEYRELLLFLAWRDIKVRYKQTSLGIAWAVIQPVTTMLIFTGIFGKLAQVPSEGLPYPIFAFSAVLPWNYFAGALTISTNSVVTNSNLISKVYFPRIIVPLSGVISGVVDFGIGLVILIGMMFWFGIVPTWGIVVLPCFLLLATATALGVGLWLSALNARYRDIGYLIPFLIQCWMYASPVAYPVSLVPEKWRLVYSLNPMVGVIEGFRWGLLGKQHPAVGVMAVSILAVIGLLVAGVCFFKHMERTFADVV